ncbi:MAG: DMT family protein [Bacteroidota bacterium]|nr:DMT family protein [Candidatus Kapabacteria bacterium]MCX7937740.1 DMT family protein [Chlorobiota bacterium]MDW8272226.1 DMT family protein [Bacteroidota bacterium]
MLLRGIVTILLLLISNTFMTFAWYGHLRYSAQLEAQRFGMVGIVLISWLIALFEYMFMVPANRVGYVGTGGPFTLFQLRAIQEAVSLVVFVVIAVAVFGTVRLGWNHVLGFILLIGAVLLIFRS